MLINASDPLTLSQRCETLLSHQRERANLISNLKPAQEPADNSKLRKLSIMEYITQPYKFNFKKRVVKDETGAVLAEVKKKPSVEVNLPVLSIQGIIDALSIGGKETELVLGAVNDIFYQAARGQFDDVIENMTDPDGEVTASMLDFDKLTLNYIANLPKSARGASALTDDEWNYFFSDYLAVMVAATGKEEKRILNQIEHFKKPQRIKANTKVLEVLVDQLSIYTAKTAVLEDTAQCAERLLTKFSKWIEDLAVSTDPDAL